MTIFDIFFNDDHDIELDGSDLAFADETTSLKQKLTIRLQFLLEEWFMDNRVGVPYTQFIFEQGSNLEDIYAIFQEEIANTEGVENITELELTPTPDDKIMQVDFSVNDNTVSLILEVNI